MFYKKNQFFLNYYYLIIDFKEFIKTSKLFCILLKNQRIADPWFIISYRKIFFYILYLKMYTHGNETPKPTQRNSW